MGRTKTAGGAGGGKKGKKNKGGGGKSKNKGRNERRGPNMTLVERFAVIQEHQSRTNVRPDSYQQVPVFSLWIVLDEL